MSTDFTSLWAMLARHIDQPAVMRALDAHFAAKPVAPQATVTHELGRDAVLGRLVLSDVLDEDIAAARPDAPGLPSYHIRARRKGFAAHASRARRPLA